MELSRYGWQFGRYSASNVENCRHCAIGNCIIAAEQCSLHENEMSYLIVAHNFGGRAASFALRRKVFAVSCCTTFVDVVPNLAC